MKPIEKENIDRQMVRQTDRQAERQIDRHTGRQTRGDVVV